MNFGVVDPVANQVGFTRLAGALLFAQVFGMARLRIATRMPFEAMTYTDREYLSRLHRCGLGVFLVGPEMRWLSNQTTVEDTVTIRFPYVFFAKDRTLRLGET